MSSTSFRRKHRTELASFHSAFLADDTLVTIVPTFDSDSPIPLLSATTPAGPFKAGIPTNVPLWLAMLLQQRSLCSLKVPEWLSTEHLTKVKQFERDETSLTPSFSVSTATTQHDEDDDDDDDFGKASSSASGGPNLPFYYAELGHRFTSAKASALGGTNNSDDDPTSSLAGSAAQASKASGLLLADICQIRLDKLRQQFQYLAENNRHETHLTVQVPGIASVELVQMKPMILQALQDQRFLATTAASVEPESSSSRRSRRKLAAGDDDNNDDEDEPLSATQDSSTNRNALRSRVRRFRGGD